MFWVFYCESIRSDIHYPIQFLLLQILHGVQHQVIIPWCYLYTKELIHMFFLILGSIFAVIRFWCEIRHHLINILNDSPGSYWLALTVSSTWLPHRPQSGKLVRPLCYCFKKYCQRPSFVWNWHLSKAGHMICATTVWLYDQMRSICESTAKLGR